MIFPWLSILDLQTLYSNIKKPLECTEESSSDYTIVVPVFKDPSYLRNYEYLKQHKDKIVIASLLGQNSKMDAFIDSLMSEGFEVNADLDKEQNFVTEYYSLMKRTIETEVYDKLLQLSVRSVKTKYTIFLDGDSVPNGNIGRAIAVMEREGLDLASVRVIPSSEERLIEKMQAIEYKIAMRGRHFRPWLTSGACLIGRTSALRDIMNTHSLYFSGGDAEVGIIAKEMKQKIGFINFTVLTKIPGTFWSWFKQRVSWYGGTFRLFAVNFNKHLKSPLLLTYAFLFGFALLPFKVLEILQDWTILPAILLFYIPITFANWQVRNRYMLLYPLYSAFQCLVMPFLGVFKYLHTLAKYKTIGRIKVRKRVADASAQEEETVAMMMFPLPEEGQTTDEDNRSVNRRIAYQDLKLTNYIKFGSRTKKRRSGKMAQAEILPQSMVDMKTIVLKPRLDNRDIRLIGERIKSSLFTRFGFKSKSSKIRLLASETYFEPYLIIGGKYVLDYCRKHAFEVPVDRNTSKIYVAGQEFRSEKSGSKITKAVVKMTGEEHVHHERQAYYILDRMKREIPPEKLPISPFQTLADDFQPNSSYRSIEIPDGMQIDFLKTKIAQRPKDVAEIIREVFDITDRTIAYYPVYQLTFENGKNGKDATVTVNGVTGEIFLNKTKKLAAKTIIDPDQGTGIRSNLATLYEVAPPEPILNFNPPETTKSAQTFPKEKETIQPTKFEEETMILGFPAKITGKVFTEGNNMAAVVGDIEIPPRTSVNKTLVVKGTLRIGENCKVRGKLKAQNINVGAKTIIDGDVISGENGLFGSGVLITGRLQAGGHIRIGEQATINQGSDLDPTAEMDNNIQLEANLGNTVDSVAHETRKAKSAKSN